MNAIILAGGYAERLWPLTIEYPKSLLIISGKPVLYHILDSLTHIPSIEKLLIAIDENKVEYFKDKEHEINTYSKLRPELSVHKMNKDGSPKGPITKIKEIIASGKNFKLTNDDFLIIGGDNIFGFDINDFCDFYLDKKSNCVASQIINEGVDTSQYGITKTDKKNRLTDFLEKPSEDYYEERSSCCYILTKSDLKYIHLYLEHLKPNKEENLGDFIHSLIGKTDVYVFKFEKPWFDIGNREDLISANAYLIKNNKEYQKDPKLPDRSKINRPLYVEDSSIIQESIIYPGVYIGSNSKIVKSTIINSIIYDNCQITESTIRNSIIGQGSKIEGFINEAVLGPNMIYSK